MLGRHVTNVRALTREDLGTVDVSRLVINSQDHFHARQRMERALNSKAPDSQALLQRFKKILSKGSCAHNDPFAATTPKELQQEAAQAALVMQNGFMSLISEFSVQLSAKTREERKDADVRALGAAILQKRAAAGGAAAVCQRGPDNAPAAQRQRGLVGEPDVDVAPLFRPRSLNTALDFENAPYDIVRSFVSWWTSALARMTVLFDPLHLVCICV